MASTITNFSSIIDAQFPVPGQDNDTQGFRNNFGNIQQSLEIAAFEIGDLQIVNSGIIDRLNTISSLDITTSSIVTNNISATNINVVSLTSTNLTVTGSATVAGSITADQFIGDGSLLTNIPTDVISSVGTLTSLSISKTLTLGTGTDRGTNNVSMTVSKDKLLLDGVSSINFITTQTLTKTLVETDITSSPGYVSTLTLSNVTGLEVGYTFQFFSTETNVHIINSINTASNKITTDSYNHSDITDLGYGGSGSVITFKIAKTNDIIDIQNQLTKNSAAIANLSSQITTTNITIQSNTTTNITTATITAENNRLVLNGVSGITLVGTDTTSKTLEAYAGSGPDYFISTLTLSNVVGIDVGYTFKLYSTETTVHTVLGVNTVTNEITTDPFDSSIPQDLGVGAGDPIIFTQGTLIGTVSYAAFAPVSNIGKATDKKGHIYANTSSIYICYEDYNSSTPIWNIFNHVDLSNQVTRIQTTATTNFNNISVLQTTTSALSSRVTSLESAKIYYATSAPLTSKGQSGDLKGTIYATTNTMYICHTSYTNGTVDIWSRTSITGGTW